jgi:hypothetical protein
MKSANFTREREFLAHGEKAMIAIFEEGNHCILISILGDVGSDNSEVSGTGVKALRGAFGIGTRLLHGLERQGFKLGTLPTEAQFSYAIATRNWVEVGHLLSYVIGVSNALRMHGTLTFRDVDVGTPKQAYVMRFIPVQGGGHEISQ